jgi:hypothetical protein
MLTEINEAALGLTGVNFSGFTLVSLTAGLVLKIIADSLVWKRRINTA